MTKKEAFESFSTKRSDERTAEKQYFRYDFPEGHELRDVYGRYSFDKEKAFRYCVELKEALNGKGLVILSHNIMCFSVGFTFPHPETGAECFAYITRDYNRFCFIQ